MLDETKEHMIVEECSKEKREKSIEINRVPE